MKSKNKLVPRLLGITKESVMRVDERTKDVVQEWPLTTVKRWAASPKSFTLVRRAARRSRIRPFGSILFLFPQQFTDAISCFVLRELSFKTRIRTDASPACSRHRRALAVQSWKAPSFHSLAHFINPTALLCLPSRRLRLVSSPPESISNVDLIWLVWSRLLADSIIAASLPPCARSIQRFD